MVINENNFKLIEEVFKDEIAGKTSSADAGKPKAKRPYHRKAKPSADAKK